MDWHYIPDLPDEIGYYIVQTVDGAQDQWLWLNDFDTQTKWLQEVIAWAAL